MIGGWKSYGSGILTQLQHYIPNSCQLSSIDGFLIWYCVHFLLRVGSFGCSIFIPLRLLSFPLYSMICILVFVSLYYLVCSSNKFTFCSFSVHVCTFLFVSFRSLLCLVLATLSVKNNFLWWVVNHCPLFLYLGVLFSIHSISLLSKISKLVDNSSPRIELYLKNIHSICILQTTAIRHHYQSQTPRLDKLIASTLRYHLC